MYARTRQRAKRACKTRRINHFLQFSDARHFDFHFGNEKVNRLDSLNDRDENNKRGDDADNQYVILHDEVLDFQQDFRDQRQLIFGHHRNHLRHNPDKQNHNDDKTNRQNDFRI